MPSSASHSPKPRTPGMSTMRPAPGTSTISRLTVVWRPLPSPSRTAPTLKTSAPTSMFTRLDFPTPERPMSTVVVPGARSARTASTDAGSSSDTTSTSAAGAARARTASTVARVAASSARSALVSTTVTSAPVSKASTSSRSRRRRFTSPTGWATITRSKLAASTWGTARSVGSLRTNSRVRGAMASMTPLSCAGGTATSTTSPITARRRSPFTRAVACSQRRSSPSSKRTSGYPRSSFTTSPR